MKQCIALVLVTLTTFAHAQNAPRLPEGAKALRDVPYVKDGHKAQVLDLYLPFKTDKPAPLIIWIHGGAWLGGSKAQCPALPLLAKGYAVASVEYRLSQVATYPAQIHDCKAAVRYLRASAKDHNIDPDKFGAWGSSAGGHLVALLGTSADVKELEGDLGEHKTVSSRVQAVVDFFGPTDLTAMGDSGKIDHDSPTSPEARLMGFVPKTNKEKAAAANPITFVSKDDAPFLIMHGDKDDTVPMNQSELLNEALKKAGVEVTYKVMAGQGHGFRGVDSLTPVNEFFDKHLKK
jgi:acetyl esterase/lipase